MTTTDDLLAARGHEYGGFRLNASKIAAAAAGLDLAHLIRRNHPAVYPIVMIVIKLARLSSNPDHLDSWRDIAGYAELMVTELSRD